MRTGYIIVTTEGSNVKVYRTFNDQLTIEDVRFIANDLDYDPDDTEDILSSNIKEADYSRDCIAFGPFKLEICPEDQYITNIPYCKRYEKKETSCRNQL